MKVLTLNLISETFSQFKRYWLLLIAPYMFVFVLNFINTADIANVYNIPFGINIILYLATSIISLIAFFTTIYNCKRVVFPNDTHPTLLDHFKSNGLKFILTSIYVPLKILLGFILFILPGFYWGSATLFSYFASVLEPKETNALKISETIFRKKPFFLFFLFFLGVGYSVPSIFLGKLFGSNNYFFASIAYACLSILLSGFCTLFLVNYYYKTKEVYSLTFNEEIYLKKDYRFFKIIFILILFLIFITFWLYGGYYFLKNILADLI